VTEPPRPAPATGYYGQPVLKPPVWTWEVPAYFFIGGLAGAAALIAAAGRAAGAPDGLVRAARRTAAAGAILSPPLLISDLGRPGRFLHMLRVVKPQSPMSVGAWTLVVFSGAAGVAALADGAGDGATHGAARRRIGDGAGLAAAASGVVLATYTGVLIGATAVPAWSRQAAMWPLHFGVSSLGSAAAFLEVTGRRDRPLHRLGVAAAAVESLVAVWVEMRAADDTRVMAQGGSGTLTRVAGALSGPLPLAMRLAAGSTRRRWRVAAALTALAGAAASRAAWLAAGRASAGATPTPP
jgi:formate-dependent nitrite reductase membrane component NrfD